jgi:Flp pilus assembly protein TadD
MHNKHLILSSLLGSLLLSACNGGIAPIDSKGFLSTLDGPNVPTMEESLTDSAKNAEMQGNFKQAAQFYEQVLAKSPDNKDALLSLADSYRRDGQTDKAIQVYDSLLAKDPDNLGAKEGKGLALIASGDFDTPAVLFEEVMKADAKRWKTLNALGILFTTRNLQTEAQQYFAEALKYHKDNPSILNNLGLSQALNRDFNVSIETLSKGSALAASGSMERKRIDLNLALVHAIAGNLDDAKLMAETYLSGAALDNNLGLYAHLAKDDQMARSYLNKALTDSKVYYAKAWENLEEINNSKNIPAEKSRKASSKSKAVTVKESKPSRSRAISSKEKSDQMRELYEATSAEAKAEPTAASVEAPPVDTSVNYGANAAGPEEPAPATAPASPAVPAAAPASAETSPAAGNTNDPAFRPRGHRKQAMPDEGNSGENIPMESYTN